MTNASRLVDVLVSHNVTNCVSNSDSAGLVDSNADVIKTIRSATWVSPIF